jgi:RNA polymerase sigma-32 factor
MRALVTQEDAALERYMAEVKRIPMLPREEEDRLARQYRDHGDIEAAHKLTTANLRFVVKVAYQFRTYGMRMLDLIQEGNMGLMRAVQKFNPDRGYRLISYAVWWIKAFLQAHVLKSYSLVKLGTTQAQRKIFFRLRAARARLEQEASARGAELSPKQRLEELAGELGVDSADVMEMELRLAARDFSLDAEVGEESHETHVALLPSPDEDVEEGLARRQVGALLKRDVSQALSTLSAKERQIVEERLMADDAPTLREIGERWGVSRERARQIEASALQKIKGYLTAHSPVVQETVLAN